MHRSCGCARLSLTLLVAVMPALAQARVINVTTTADELNVDGDCSLREAVQAANTNAAVDACPAGTPGADTVVLPAGSYPVATGLAPTEALSIAGTTGQTTVSGAGISSQFLRFTVPGTFSLSGLTITTGSTFAVWIDNAGTTVNLTDCRVSGFTGVWVNSGSTSIASSELMGTAAGLDVWVGSATVVNSTFHGSSIIGTYGAITLNNNATARVSHSTFNGNAYAFYGEGSSSLTLKGCIIAGNSQATFNTFTSTFVSNGYNLSDDALATRLNHATDRIGINPLLNALAANGTTASGYRLQPTSPALNTGTCTDNLGAVVSGDQWGVGRPSFGGCDVGALEANPVVAVLTSAEAAGANCANAGTRLQIGLDWNNDGAPDTGITTRYICNGAAGSAGYSTLVSVTSEPAGGNCANGGQRLATGLDDGQPSGTAGNGVLEAGEVTSTSYLCNGSAGAAGATGSTGANGFDSLVSVTDEAAGLNCANGGKKIGVGLDDGTPTGTARNGTLEPGEVDSTYYVCNGAPGPSSGGYNSLVLLSDEAAGANCANGGKRIQTGLDDGLPSGTASNGALEQAEVDATSYVCNGAPGATGATGATGAPGATGAAGADGADGRAGGCAVAPGATGEATLFALLVLGALLARRRLLGG